MKPFCFVACCSVCLTALAQLPAPKLYYPLDGTLPPIAGVMPVNGTGVFGDGQPGFGQAVTNSANQLRAPLGYNEGAEPGTGDWTLSFWTRFDWANLTLNFRLFSKGGQSDSGDLISGFQIYCRTTSFSTFFATRTATARESINANQFQTKFKNNEWNHVVFMRRSAAMRIYLNGEFIAEKNPIAGGASGDYGVKTNSTNGSLATQLSPEVAIPNWGLDDVATWMSALTDQQITDLYTQGTNGIPLSGLVTVPTYETTQNGTWENAATWQTQPKAASTAFVRHEVTASSALPTLFTLAVSDGAALALGDGTSLEVTKTGEDCLRVGQADSGSLSLAGGTALTVAGLANVGAESNGSGGLDVDASTLYAGDGLRIGHNGGTGTATVRNGSIITVNKSLYVGNETNSLGQRSSGTLTVDAATVNVTNDYLSVGRNGASGTLILTNNATLNKSGANSIEFGNRADSVSALVMDGSTLNIQNSATEVQFGKYGSHSTVSLTDSAINMGARLDFAHQSGSFVASTLTRSTITKTSHDGIGLLFCEGGAATSLFTAVDATLSITRSGGTGVNGIQLAPSTGGVCLFSNLNSTVELISTNGSRIYLAGGVNSCVTYVQVGSAARMTSPGDLRLGDGSGSATEFRQRGGAVAAATDLWLAPSSTASADYWLSGGTLTARSVRGGTGAGARLIFDGGTYVAGANATTVLADGTVQVLFNADTQAGFDTAGHMLALLQFHAPQGAGGLTKQGAGTLRIPGTYLGPTVVEAGTLALYNAVASSNLTVADGAELRFEGLTNTAVSATSLALAGTLTFGADAAGLTTARLTLTGAAITLGDNAKIAFPSGMALLPGKTFPFLDTNNETLGVIAQNADNIPDGWMVAKDGTLYTLREITPTPPPLGRDDIVVWLSRETIETLPTNQIATQVGAFAGTGLVVSNAPRNDLLAQVKAVYFNGALDQAMHGPSAPEGITSNNTWSASMWVWSSNRANHEPTVVCWGLRKGLPKQNCSLNHASTESRAASFYGVDPKYTSGAPALDSWQHIVFSYDGATSGQGLSVYVNGEPRTLDQSMNNLIIPSDGQTILLGNQHEALPQSIVGGGRPYEGFLGELVIFNNTMTQAEASQLYTNGLPTYVGSTALPDDDQIFETTDYHNWTDAAGWINGNVPYGNSALVTGRGVTAVVDSAVPTFINLRVENEAAVNVVGTTFRPDGLVAVSNSAAFSISGGGLLDPSGHVYVGGGSSLLVTGTGSKLFAQALNNPLRIGNETAALSTLSITDGGSVEVRNSNLQVAYNTDTNPGNGLLTLTNATLTIGSSTVGGGIYVGYQSGTGTLVAVDSAITVNNSTVRIGGSYNNGTACGNLLLDNTSLTVSGGGLFLAACENEMFYRSMDRATTLVIRNKSTVSCTSEFILGNRNAASDYNQPMTANVPAVLVLDDSTLTCTSYGSVARQNGLGTLILTNNAQVIKRGVNHFRIGTDGNATTGQGANTNPYTEGRVYVSNGGVLDVQASTNELRIASGTPDCGYLFLGAGGTVKAYTITGAGTRGAFVFDGGTLQAHASTNAFVTCAVPLLITEGKQAIIDTQSYSNTIPVAFGGAGGLLKKGAGTLTLTALSTNTGPVTVEQGTLILTDGSGVGGTLMIPATNTVTVQLGVSNVAETVSLGGLHLAKSLTLDFTAPGVCDTLLFTTAAGFTTEADVGLTLGYAPDQFSALFDDPTVKYLIAQAPADCANGPQITNLPKGWFIAAQPSGGKINYVLTSKLGTLMFLK